MAENGRSRTWLWILIGGGAFFLFVLAVFTLVYLTLHAGGEQASLHSFGDKIGVVELEGVILDPKTVVAQLKKFGDDDSIKAIIIHVNSPGGGVAASEEIYREVKRIRDEKTQAHRDFDQTVGASGAYYIASATNKIYADNGSVVGSIGVIARVGELRRPAALGQAETGSPEGRRIQRHRRSHPRDDPGGTGLHAVADRQHVRPVRAGGGRGTPRQGRRH